MRFVCDLEDLFWMSNRYEHTASNEIRQALLAGKDTDGTPRWTIPGAGMFNLAQVLWSGQNSVGHEEDCARDRMFTSLELMRRLGHARARSQAVFFLVILRRMERENSDSIEINIPWTRAKTRCMYVKRKPNIEFGLV
ncbi:MAG: hypothetical protein WDN10_03935 [bacterium]